jgi:hypothetical protein
VLMKRSLMPEYRIPAVLVQCTSSTVLPQSCRGYRKTHAVLTKCTAVKMTADDIGINGRPRKDVTSRQQQRPPYGSCTVGFLGEAEEALMEVAGKSVT